MSQSQNIRKLNVMHMQTEEAFPTDEAPTVTLTEKSPVKGTALVDKELLYALAGISSQDSCDFRNTQDSSQDDEEESLIRQKNMEKMMECFQNLQNCVQKVQQTNSFIYQLTPMEHQLEARRRQFFSRFEKTITIESTDPILYGICNIDRYGDNNENIQVVSLDFQQEIMKAKLKGDYPENQSQNQFNIRSVEKASFWKSKCLCEISRKRLIFQNRSVENIIIVCKICDNKGNVGPEQVHKILKDNLGSRVTSQEWDLNWTTNMYGQVIWKLACYNQFFNIQSLTLFNILHNLSQKLMKEFLEIKKSFFQKAVVKEIPPGAHCILLITSIKKSQNKGNPKSWLIELSDGSYSMIAFVNEFEKRFNCDQDLIGLIENGQIQVGEKYHFFGLYLNNSEMLGKDRVHRLNTDHYFLQNKHSMYLKININGMQRAHNNERLGEQPFPFFRIPLTSINQYSKQICCMDVFIIKKTAQYYLEEFTIYDSHENSNRRKRILRSKKAMERIRFLRQEAMEGKLQKDYENMFFRYQRDKNQNENQLAEETEALKERMEELRKEKLECFKLCFRVKVADAIYYEKIMQKEREYKEAHPEGPQYRETQEYKREVKKYQTEIAKNRTIIISFIKSSPELYDAIQDGQRIRFYNLKPDGTIAMHGGQIKNEQCIFLQFQNGRSKIETIQDKMREKCGSFIPPKVKLQIQNLKEFGRELVIQPIKPQQYLQNIIEVSSKKDEEQITNYKKCNEMTFIGYIVKIFYQPNPEGPNHPDSVSQAILLSAQGDIICIQIHDPHFFIKNAFPGENQRVVMDHIAFIKMSRVNVQTRDNDLIEDKKMGSIFKDYLHSVLCTDFFAFEQRNEDDLKLPDNFYYLMCQTNNNTQIETESNRHMIEFKNDCLEMSLFLDSKRFKLRMRQISMIIGERQSNSEDSYGGSGGAQIQSFRNYGVKHPEILNNNLNTTGPMQGYNYMNLDNVPVPKNMLISSSGIQDQKSPQKESKPANFNFKSKYMRQGFHEVIKKKAKPIIPGGLQASINKKCPLFDKLVQDAMTKKTVQALAIEEQQVTAQVAPEPPVEQPFVAPEKAINWGFEEKNAKIQESSDDEIPSQDVVKKIDPKLLQKEESPEKLSVIQEAAKQSDDDLDDIDENEETNVILQKSPNKQSPSKSPSKRPRFRRIKNSAESSDKKKSSPKKKSAEKKDLEYSSINYREITANHEVPLSKSDILSLTKGPDTAAGFDQISSNLQLQTSIDPSPKNLLTNMGVCDSLSEGNSNLEEPPLVSCSNIFKDIQNLNNLK